MKRHPILAACLSLLVPGLGQMYAGEGRRGATILAAAIAIANLNILPLPLIAMATPLTPAGLSDSRALWAYWIPRVVHDIASFWSVAFWLWAIGDAHAVARHADSRRTLAAT
jgi:TM2 domain-containing membrane protein YozV